MENTEKKNTGFIILVVVLVIMVIGLASYIVYDKVLDSKSDTIKADKTIKSYKIGDKVTVKLNDSLEKIFYVLSDSSEDEEDITLFAEKNIGNSAFNNNYTDGNDYEDSLIESKLNELTSSWTNVKSKRLITVDEIKDTHLVEIIVENKCGIIENNCIEESTYVEENSFLLYPDEFYWTMSKVNDADITNNTNHYVYIVNSTGAVESHIVGYEPYGEENKNGTYFDNFGIRPVIVISKEFVS